MADRVGREEGWQAAEREAGGVGDSYNAADEIGVVFDVPAGLLLLPARPDLNFAIASIYAVTD